MNGFEKIHFETTGIDEEGVAGVYFAVEDDPLMVEFDEKLRTCDIVILCKGIAQRMFEKRSSMEQFVRERGFTTVYNISQHVFVFEKEMPWNE